MNNRWNYFWILPAICLACLVGCGKKVKTQTIHLDDKTRVILKDAFLIDHAPPLLQVVIVYEGPDPNGTYDFEAALRDTKDGPDVRGSWIKQYPTPSTKNTNEHEVIWEFMSFPKESKQIFLRLDCTEKQSGRDAGKLEFLLPGVPDLQLHKLGQ